MSSFSKTDIPCDCGWLSAPINDPKSGVVYDALMNMIVIHTGETDYPLYHCPFCGGSFPDSSKPMWVPVVPQAEFDRFRDLSANLTSVEEIFERLGTPDSDGWSSPGEEYRCIGYYNLSEFLTLEFAIARSGQVNSIVQIRCLSPRQQVVVDKSQ